MNLRNYYQKIRDVEARLGEEFPVVVSRETADGGRGGTRTEVTRRLAAKLVVDGMAQLATPEEAKAYREEVAEAKRVSDQEAAASRVQLTVLSTSELNQMKAEARKAKG